MSNTTARSFPFIHRGPITDDWQPNTHPAPTPQQIIDIAEGPATAHAGSPESPTGKSHCHPSFCSVGCKEVLHHVDVLITPWRVSMATRVLCVLRVTLAASSFELGHFSGYAPLGIGRWSGDTVGPLSRL